MTFQEYVYVVSSDLYRYYRTKSVAVFFKSYFLMPGFKYTFWLRTAKFFKGRLILFPFYALSRLWLRRLQCNYGIYLPYNTIVGSGLYIGHFGGIVVNSNAVIGKNCNINQGVTIGVTYGGKFPGTPVIGDNVYIGPGSFIIGGIEIGSNVAIGANTVVNKPIPENAVVVSPPGEVVSFNGSGGYIINTDY
jgi:serine O-acetyltransferase